MYFQIENTPEYIRRARQVKDKPKESPKEECPRLILAPFSRPPQVVFENVLIGSPCERVLEVLNPSNQTQKITLGKALPPGLEIHLPGEWMELEPETCYDLIMTWTPTQPTAMRETIRFTNEKRGRYDVIVVLKSAMIIKGKSQPKSFKTSPGKMKKKKTQISKKSPVAIYKKKAEIIYNTTTRVQKTVNMVKSVQHKVYETYDKENFSGIDKINYSMNPNQDKCPFGSPSSMTNFDTSEIFADMRKTNLLQDTYDISYSGTASKTDIPLNVLKPSNKQVWNSPSCDIFDNLTLTPLKSTAAKVDKLNKGPQIIISVNSESDLDDSLDIKTSSNDNQTHSIVGITTFQHPTNRLTPNLAVIQNHLDVIETPVVQNKKHPDTSSPKELNNPNFSINTDCSRISDLSFQPQRFSTERKWIAKVNETQELLNDKVSSDIFTKDSPNTPMEYGNQPFQAYDKPPHYFNRDQPKMCRQNLFIREYQMREAYDHNPWHNELRFDERSPPRSITPPLQSIPEESAQFSRTQILEKSDNQATFTIDRTFDKTCEKSSMSTRETWSKKNVRIESDAWKVPITYVKKATKPRVVSKPRDFTDSKMSNVTFESDKSINQNITINQIGNIYSQTSTVDPFLSVTYFYDEEAVHKFENEFKRWLNCILTPPADLECNEVQKVDLGKAWIESRNKEVPLAPTKEQVSSAYHNSHRLESLRRSAKNLLMSKEMAQVFQKLNLQIEKKLITIRADRNLHMDVGLQKLIMEILLSYNPLWLRIGLEAIYGIVLPLKSNSDIEGLTSFIIQRMFKNPYLKNKNSKSTAPNMLVPAYMEAIKKFTLKKFFMLVYFLDQAKQRKLISHDPCLFCRNAVCKESREIIIRFTRELIAGIGDITRHLKPLGYVVSHKQSYLDEYKYAVHNLALDIRDGVRLTKVMEIIMMKNGLLKQLRTPAISRLQKIHNVQVAMDALKEANFVIVGEITATDIADGHREKTLSLLWQIIHVFRAPLFEKAANIIQIWWRKKYQVIAEKRKEEIRIAKMKTAAITIQDYLRSTVIMKKIREEYVVIRKSAIVIQRYFRSYLLAKSQRKEYIKLRNTTVLLQKRFRSLLCMRKVHKAYMDLRNATSRIQSQYRAQVAMRKEREQFNKLKMATLAIQRRYRALVQSRVERSNYLKMKSSCIKIQITYRAYRLGKPDREHYLKQKEAAIKIQKWFRSCKKVQKLKQEYQKSKRSCVIIQRYFRAYIVGRQVHQEYLRTKNAAICLQRFFRAYLTMKAIKQEYIRIKTSTVIIQKFYRSHLETTRQRKEYLKIKSAVSCIQNAYRRHKECENIRKQYLRLREAAITVQRWYRSIITMRMHRKRYMELKRSAVTIQEKFRAVVAMRVERQSYFKLRSAVIVVQAIYRAQCLMRQERLKFITIQKACISIQKYYRAYVVGKKTRLAYKKLRAATIILQSRYKALLAMRKEKSSYLAKKNAAVAIQRRFRANKLMLRHRQEYLKILKSCKTIQSYFRAFVASKKQRSEYNKIKTSVILVQKRFRMLLETRKVRKQYLQLRNSIIMIQRRFRLKQIKQNEAAAKIQTWYRSVQMRNACRKEFLTIRKRVVTVQSVIRMYIVRKIFLRIRTSTMKIQRYYCSYKLAVRERQLYTYLRTSIIKLQSHVRKYIARKRYVRLRDAVRTIQDAYRLKKLRDLERKRQHDAAIILQKYVRRYLVQSQYKKYREKVMYIQKIWRGSLITRLMRCDYLQKKRFVTKLQALARGYIVRKQVQANREQMLKIKEMHRQTRAAAKIQALFRGNKVRSLNKDSRVSEIRRRWRAGSLRSSQPTLGERNKDALEVLRNVYGIDAVIRAFRTLELMSEVHPMAYDHNAASVVRRVFIIMSTSNRSISSVEMLKSAAALVVNLARYKVTGPKIYDREHIAPILKYMWRFVNSEKQLFCIFATYLWLCSKYDACRKDLTEFLHIPEHHKLMVTIKSSVDRTKRMEANSRNAFNTPQSCKKRHPSHSINSSTCIHHADTSHVMPCLSPDYGITRINKTRYFEDLQHAINCLFDTFNLY